jgi:Uma2 family endonuclease
MSAVVSAPPLGFRPPRHFDNGAQWLAALGDVPMERVVFDPWPGSATEADLLALVERDKRLCELIDNTLVEKPMGYWEGIIAMQIGALLLAFVSKADLGAVTGPDATVRMKSGRIRLPDVGFVSKERLPRVWTAIPSVSPDLAVEVLSETNAAREMKEKLAEYFESGTRLAWIVDPRTRTVAIHHDPGEPTQVVDETSCVGGDPVLPGMVLAVAEFFRNVPRA